LDDLKKVQYHLPIILEECRYALDDLFKLVQDSKQNHTMLKTHITPDKIISSACQHIATNNSPTKLVVNQIKTKVIDKVEQTKRRTNFIWKVSAAAAVGVAVMVFMRRRKR